MDQIDKLLAIISKDKENPSIRLVLSQNMQLTDRECRELRRQAFLNGYPIVSFSSMSGSYLTDSKEDVKRYADEAYSRALKELEIVRASKRILENWDQLKINELV